jgi:hypothetical protein
MPVIAGATMTTHIRRFDGASTGFVRMAISPLS